MPRTRRLSISSFFSFRGEESDSDDTPAPPPASNTAPKTTSNAAPKTTRKRDRFSTRIRTHLKGLFPGKPPETPAKNISVQGDPPTAEAIYLASLRSLPPLSPVGRHYANEMGQGNITFAHFAGEDYFRWLQDGLPGYEEVVGDEKAYYDRYLIEVHRRADYTELHDLFIPGNLWYPSEKWDPAETRYISRKPYPIRTTGVAVVKRQRSTVISSEKGSSSRVHKRANSSPDVLFKREKTAYPTNDSGDKSPIRPKPSGTFAKVPQSPNFDFDEGEEVLLLKQKWHVELLESIPTQFDFKKLEIRDPYKG